MYRIRSLAARFAIAASSLGAATAAAQSASPDSVVYVLNGSDSAFEWGCLGPCACPVLFRSPLTGSFVLRRSHEDELFTYYDVRDVRWRVPATSQAPATEIVGSGTYRRGGEVALMEQMTLDVSFDGGPMRHFDSGLVPPGAPFPRIHVEPTTHTGTCFDSMLVVDASPMTVGVGGEPAPPVVSAAPNPFAASTEIAFTLPAAGAVTLDVFDLGGRRVRRIVGGERLGAGTHVRAWDGRLDTGSSVSPGLYVVRLETPRGRSARMVAKLR